MEIMKKLMVIFGAAVAVATAICAIFFWKYIEISLVSLFAAFLLMANVVFGIGILKGSWNTYGRFRHMSGLRYTKRESKGEFEKAGVQGVTVPQCDRVVAYISIMIGAMHIPFIFFFSTPYKIFVPIGLVCIFTLITVAVDMISTALKMKREREAKKAEEERQQKELEEQKERESMGRWK